MTDTYHEKQDDVLKRMLKAPQSKIKVVNHLTSETRIHTGR